MIISNTKKRGVGLKNHDLFQCETEQFYSIIATSLSEAYFEDLPNIKKLNDINSRSGQYHFSWAILEPILKRKLPNDQFTVELLSRRHWDVIYIFSKMTGIIYVLMSKPTMRKVMREQKKRILNNSCHYVDFSVLHNEILNSLPKMPEQLSFVDLGEEYAEWCEVRDSQKDLISNLFLNEEIKQFELISFTRSPKEITSVNVNILTTDLQIRYSYDLSRYIPLSDSQSNNVIDGIGVENYADEIDMDFKTEVDSISVRQNTKDEEEVGRELEHLKEIQVQSND